MYKRQRLERFRQQILVGNAEYGAVRHTARRTVNHDFALGKQFCIDGEFRKTPEKITQCIQTTGQQLSLIHISALDELEVAWQQQQTLVQEIIALRQQLLGVAEDDVASLPDADAVEDTPPEAEQDSTDAESADDAGSVQPEETAETVSPVQRLAQLTAELDALHNDQLLVSPHVDKKQIAAVIAEWTGVPLNRLSQNEMSVITDLPVRCV